MNADLEANRDRRISRPVLLAILIVGTMIGVSACTKRPPHVFPGFKKLTSSVEGNNAVEAYWACRNNDRTYTEDPCNKYAIGYYHAHSEGWYRYQFKGCERQEHSACYALYLAALPESLWPVFQTGRSYLEDHGELRKDLGWQHQNCQRGDALGCKLIAAELVAVARLEADVRKRMVASDATVRGRLQQLLDAMLSASGGAKAPSMYISEAERHAVREAAYHRDDPDLRRDLIPVLERYCRNGRVTPDTFEAVGMACFAAGLLHMSIADPNEIVRSSSTAAGYPSTEDAMHLAAIACTTHGNQAACTFAQARGIEVNERAGQAHAEAMGKRWERLNEARGRRNEIREREQAAERRIKRQQQEAELDRIRQQGLAQIRQSAENHRRFMESLPGGGGRAMDKAGSNPRRPAAAADRATPSGKPATTADQPPPASDKAATGADKPATPVAPRIVEAYAWFYQHRHVPGKADYYVYTLPQKTPHFEGNYWLFASHDVVDRAERAIDNFLRNKDSSYRGQIGAPEENALVGSLAEARQRVNAAMKDKHAGAVPARKPQYVVLLDPMSGAVQQTLVVPAAPPPKEKKGAGVAL